MKWWISDFDGTLTLNPKTEAIDPKDMDFIERWTKENNFIIATGRDVSYINYLINHYNLKSEYKIANNGASLYKGNQLIFNQSIGMDERKQLFQIVNKLYKFCGIKIADHSECFILSGIEEKTPRYNESIVQQKWFEMEDNFSQHINEILNNKDLNNITLFAHPQDFDYILNLFNNFKNLKIIQTSPFNLEIMHKDVSKYSGIKFLKNKYNISDNDIVVSGDGDNDYEMLNRCKNSFAMEKGTKKAIMAANNIISNVYEIENYISIN
ncbi:Cof-type HAD-IIB family hydrolase [Mesoplasma tabanidae]|uniref:HAD superfamily hydrolase n=1 Tax=Mesoplasma tabanidae TaxID=219745 RepID=A0A2K8P851_9MOLU|nr:Cof-type HAD-IIB family hydrolase [Mesoplasma tabanidae]ATZ21923.1 hypothetical protein MTABA_v1c07310 [Mesoplasma tabanidae]